MNPTPKRGRGRPRSEFHIQGEVAVAEALGGEAERNADVFVAALERVLRRQIHRGAGVPATAPEQSTTSQTKQENVA